MLSVGLLGCTETDDVFMSTISFALLIVKEVKQGNL